MKRIVLLLMLVLAMGCSKSEDKVDYKDIDGIWNFKEETNYSEATCSLLVIDWKKEFFLTATEKIRNEEKEVSKKGTFKYEYPYLTLINDDGSYPIKFKITDDKKKFGVRWLYSRNISKDSTEKIILKSPHNEGFFL